MRRYIYLLLIFFHSALFAYVQEYDLSKQELALIEHVSTSIARAEKHNSQLTQKVMLIEGMSSSKVRHLLNNLCSKPNTHYLEIGCWKGSTFIASQFSNSDTVVSAVAIDNWSEFNDGSIKDKFLYNLKRFLRPNTFKFYEADCFKVNPQEVCPHLVNVYFYDGCHERLAHELAITYYKDVLDDLFILIVDDWNWSYVREGTKDAFEKLNYKLLFERELPSSMNGDRTQWWNGLYVAVIRKT